MHDESQTAVRLYWKHLSTFRYGTVSKLETSWELTIYLLNARVPKYYTVHNSMQSTIPLRTGPYRPTLNYPNRSSDYMRRDNYVLAQWWLNPFLKFPVAMREVSFNFELVWNDVRSCVLTTYVTIILHWISARPPPSRRAGARGYLVRIS